MDGAALRRRGWLWTAIAVAHVIPLLATAALLVWLEPLSFPVALVFLAKSWIIPALYAQRGANVLRPRARAQDDAERRSVGLLGDLVGHDARDLHARSGLVLETGKLGHWLVGEAGAAVIAPGGRRVSCFCIAATGASLPSGDRIAHLLLALRSDEVGFATVANLAFSGAPWRVRARLRKAMRPALQIAVAAARAR